MHSLFSVFSVRHSIRAGPQLVCGFRSSGIKTVFRFTRAALALSGHDENAGKRRVAEGLFEFLHGEETLEHRFECWVAAIERLPRKQTRVLIWPLIAVFGFIAQPDTHIFLKPKTTKEAARKLGLNLDYKLRPNWATYKSYLEMAEVTRKKIRDFRPRDMIDIQSFLWVQGSDEYR